MKQLISAALCAGLFATQPGIIYAAEDDPIITATPVPEHSAYYSQAAYTNSIKGWPTGPSI